MFLVFVGLSKRLKEKVSTLQFGIASYRPPRILEKPYPYTSIIDRTLIVLLWREFVSFACTCQEQFIWLISNICYLGRIESVARYGNWFFGRIFAFSFWHHSS